MPKVDFYSNDYNDDISISYAIIGARFRDQWIFVKNRKRASYELAAGHIDKGESLIQAAGRELFEETGALKFVMECINIYSVTENESKKFGGLFFAEILELGDIVDTEEIEKLILDSDMPENLTFPEVQKALFARLKDFISNI